MKQKLFLLLTVIISLITVFNWTQCKGFSADFIMSGESIQLRLVDYIHTDVGITPHVVRIFHNKITESLVNTYRHVIRFWDIPFLIAFLSFSGMVGVCFGCYYGAKQKNKKLGLSLLTLIILQFVFVFLGGKFSSLLFLFLIWLFYELISLFGFYMWSKEHNLLGYIFWAALLILSVWWMLIFPTLFVQFCTKT